jgi:hypothetical protein
LELNGSTHLLRTGRKAIGMGIVKMTEKTDFISRGYAYNVATLYVYCDKCGSFKIKSYVGYRKWLLIVTACGLVSGSIFAMFRTGGQRYWIILSLLICILGLKFLWGAYLQSSTIREVIHRIYKYWMWQIN